MACHSNSSVFTFSHTNRDTAQTYLHLWLTKSTPIGDRIFSYVNTVRSRFVTVCSKTIHFYDPCRVGPSTPKLWCFTIATQVSFIWCTSSSFLGAWISFAFKFIVIFPPMTSIKKTKKKKNSTQLTLHSFLMSSEPWLGPSSTKVIWLIFFNYLCNFLYM